MSAAHAERVEGKREAGIARGRAHQRAHRRFVRCEQFKPAHQHVEQALARRLFGHVGIAAGKHCAVGLAHVRGEDREPRSECAAQIRERHLRCLGNFGKADALNRFFREQRHECVNDALAFGFAAARRGTGGGLARGFASHGRTPERVSPCDQM